MHPKYKAQVAVRGLAITIFSLTEEERLRKIQWIAQGDTSSKWQHRDSGLKHF